jgi:hypothetical protein
VEKEKDILQKEQNNKDKIIENLENEINRLK